MTTTLRLVWAAILAMAAIALVVSYVILPAMESIGTVVGALSR